MVKTERQRQIISILRKEGFKSARELGERLYISPSSIRRDLASLESEGLVRRSYGGAELLTSAESITSFDRRSIENTELKRKIAEKAVRLVHSGDIIFLDQSSTCFFLAEKLAELSDITVMTNSLQTLALLSSLGRSVNLLCSGGRVFKRNRGCLVGAGAEAGFSSMYADIAFFSTKAVSCDGVITDVSEEEISLRRAMLRGAKKKVYLCDSTKLGSISAYTQCRVEDVDMIISDIDDLSFKI